MEKLASGDEGNVVLVSCLARPPNASDHLPGRSVANGIHWVHRSAGAGQVHCVVRKAKLV